MSRILTAFLACLSLSSLAAGPKDYQKSVDRVSITVDADVRQNAGGDAQWKQVVAWLEEKKNWKKMFQRIDEQIGVYRAEGMPIAVTLVSKNTTPTRARATLGGNTATIMVSVSAFIQFSKEHRADLSKVSELFVTHELTHCLQQGPAGEAVSRGWPLWIVEGMANYAAEDPLQDEYFAVIKQQGIRDLDVIQALEVYPRGRLFFKYLLAKYGAEKLKNFVVLLYQRTEYRQAVEAVTKKTWDAFKAEELTWSKEYARKFGLQ